MKISEDFSKDRSKKYHTGCVWVGRGAGFQRALRHIYYIFNTLFLFSKQSIFSLSLKGWIIIHVIGSHVFHSISLSQSELAKIPDPSDK